MTSSVTAVFYSGCFQIGKLVIEGDPLRVYLQVVEKFFRVQVRVMRDRVSVSPQETFERYRHL
jgi:hypothetical protein